MLCTAYDWFELMKTFLTYFIFFIGFITPVLVINPMTKRESKISFSSFVAIMSFTIAFIPIFVFSCALLGFPLTKSFQDTFITGVGASFILTLCLTNYDVWSYIIPFAKKSVRVTKKISVEYIYPATKFVVLQTIIFLRFLTALVKNKKAGSEAKEKIKEIPQVVKESEAPIQPITRKEKSVQNILDKLDNF